MVWFFKKVDVLFPVKEVVENINYKIPNLTWCVQNSISKNNGMCGIVTEIIKNK